MTTFSFPIDETLLKSAQNKAQENGTNLNRLLSDFVQSYVQNTANTEQIYSEILSEKSLETPSNTPKKTDATSLNEKPQAKTTKAREVAGLLKHYQQTAVPSVAEMNESIALYIENKER